MEIADRSCRFCFRKSTLWGMNTPAAVEIQAEKAVSLFFCRMGGVGTRF
jgi:hypothetical protein